MKLLWGLLACLLIVLALCSYKWKVFGQRQSITPTQWEYTITHTVSMERGPAILNELGLQGWELVTVTPEGWAYLKRVKR